MCSRIWMPSPGSGSDVKAAYDKFIQNKPAVVLSVVPKGQERLAGRDPNFTPAKRELPDYSKHDKVLAERPVKDDFDRSVQPRRPMR